MPDFKSYFKSIELQGAQIKQSFNETLKIKLPSSFKQVKNIVVCGMGGSQLEIDIINSLFGSELKVPIIQVRDYQLPGFVDQNTLVLLISYSGGTEEVLSCGDQAKKLTNKIIAISAGGQLIKSAEKNHWPYYHFNPINNPSGQPRLGTGYLLGSVLAILKNLNLIKIPSSEVENIIKAVDQNFIKLNKNKSGFKLAKKIQNKLPVIVASGHLFGLTHLMANQIQESSKQTSLYFPLPELNHHLLEGLKFPKSNHQNLLFIFFNSKNYLPKIQKRFKLTAEVIKKQKLQSINYNLSGSKLAEASEMMVLGALISYELAKLNKVDPNAIPWVNYFKKALSK